MSLGSYNPSYTLASQGRAQRQGPSNYAGVAQRQGTTASGQAAGPQRAAGAPRPAMRPGAPVPAPARQMRQVSDVGFNRAQAPAPAQQQAAAPPQSAPPTQKMPLPQYTGMMGVQPYNGFMQGPQGQGLANALMPKQLPRGAPTQAAPAGRERADQSLMGPKANLADTLAGWYRDWDQQQRDNAAGDSNEQATQSGSAATDEPVSTNPQEDAAQERYGVRRDGSGGRDPEQNSLRNTPFNLLGNLSFEGGNPVVNQMVEDIGQLLSGVSNTMSAEDMANIEKFFGESSGAYRDIMGAARGMLDPNARNQWEDAARADLQANVNQDKLANLRMQQAAAGRGGAMSSNAGSSIYNSAANALASGERGIAQDRFGRDLAATQAGISGLGAGAGALQDLLGEGFTSNKELASMLLTGAQKGFEPAALLADILGGKWV